MARERTENGATTSLNGTINNSVTTVTVTDATVFSAAQFRIIINSEIMLVTAISSNDLTVTRNVEGSVAASHNDGSVVAQIMTRDGLRQYHRDWNNAFFDDTNGVPQQRLNSSDSTLARSDFAWTNQGSATDADNNSGSFFFTIDSQGTDQVRIFQRTLTAPWKVTAAFQHVLVGGTAAELGMCIRDNAIGTFKSFGIKNNQDLERSRWTNPTTFASNQQDLTNYRFHPVMWLQLEDDNVDHFFRISIDGVNFLQIAQETRTTHTVTPDRVGLFFNNLNTTFNMLVDLIAWVEE